MNRLHCEGRMLNCGEHAALEQTLFFPLLTVKATTPLSREDNWNCKRLALLVYTHKEKRHPPAVSQTRLEPSP